MRFFGTDPCFRMLLGRAQNMRFFGTDPCFRMGGGRKNERPLRYRDDAESAVREGLSISPWEALREQAVLGGVGFLEQIRACVRGDEQEQRGAWRLAARRPELETVNC